MLRFWLSGSRTRASHSSPDFGASANPLACTLSYLSSASSGARGGLDAPWRLCATVRWLRCSRRSHSRSSPSRAGSRAARHPPVEPSSSLPLRIACDVRVAAQRTAPGRRYCDVLPRCHRLHHVCSPDVIMARALLAIVRALDIISYAMYLCLQRRTCLRHWCLHRCNLRGAFLRFLSPRVCRCRSGEDSGRGKLELGAPRHCSVLRGAITNAPRRVSIARLLDIAPRHARLHAPFRAAFPRKQSRAYGRRRPLRQIVADPGRARRITSPAPAGGPCAAQDAQERATEAERRARRQPSLKRQPTP